MTKYRCDIGEAVDPLIRYPGYDLLLDNIVRAENCTLYDAEGKEYVDLESGVWCTSIGHGNPAIRRVMTAQAASIAHSGFSYSSEVVPEAAREVLSLHRFDGGRCIFLCSGSEAVEYGVRTAQSLMRRPLMMTMADSYFGAYGSASLKRADEWYSFDWMECTDCPDSLACNAHCARWAAIPFQRIGGFLFEPGSSSGRVRFPPEKLIRSIVSEVKAAKGLVLVNEVTTGVGRTGRWFGYQHYGIGPDIVAMGKGIGNGYPVSVTALAPQVIGRLGGATVRYAQSHQNDPMGAAIVREVIRVIHEEKLIERGRETGQVLIDGLEKLSARTNRISAIRARGLMAAVELVDGADAAYTKQVQKELFGRGFVVAQRPGLNVLRIDPALTVEKKDIERFLGTFEHVLAGS